MSSGQMPVPLDWSGETFPLHADYPSRRHAPAKVRAFIDFVVSIVA